tara:strand:+ start:1196 stop:1801 length:606 start_codon:yes stop_codon:yes gene_type:complete
MTFRITATTELQAVNTLLSIIGEAPINTITNQTGVDVAQAIQILDETNVEVQSRGWHFNTDTNKKTTIDDTGKIPVASNVVQLDAAKGYTSQYNIVLRDGFIYDLENHTDQFTSAPTIDQITIQKFEAIPEVFRKLIVTRAGRKFQARVVGSTELQAFTEFDEQQALIDAERIDAATADYNVLRDTSQVFNIINRTGRRTY